HALAFVGLGRPEGADLRRDLTDLLLIDTAHHDFGRPRRRDRNTVRDRIDHIVAVAERNLQVLALHRGAITNTGDFELALEPLGTAGTEIGDQGARSSPHCAGTLALETRIAPDPAVLHLHRDLLGHHGLQGAFRSLHFYRLAFDVRGDA